MYHGYSPKQVLESSVTKDKKPKVKCAACNKEIKPEDQRCKLKVGHQRLLLCIDCGTKIIDQLIHTAQKEK